MNDLDAMPLQSMPLAFSIPEASRMVGLSDRQFRRVYLDTGRIQSVHAGRRCRTIDAAELRSAYLKYVAETRDTN